MKRRDCSRLSIKNGYRFFGFEETFKVVEFMRLHNYGASVRDMGRMLCTNTEDAIEALDVGRLDD